MNPATIVFGGAFDPPHEGHRDCVHLVRKAFPDASIQIIPARSPAGAGDTFKTPSSEFSDRIEMCQKAFSMIPGVRVNEIEGAMPTPNFTINTLQEIAKQPGPQPRPQPLDKALCLLLGQDQLEEFHRWRQPKEILGIANLIAVRRRGFLSPPKPLRDSATKLAYHLEVDFRWIGCETLQLSDIGSIRLIDEPLCVATSREIRDLIISGRQVPSGWLPADIFSMIQERQIYKGFSC